MLSDVIDRTYLKRFHRVTVMGLGLFGGGAGAARYFAQLGAEVTVTDMAGREKLAAQADALSGLGIRFVLGEHREEDFVSAQLVVANQAVRPDHRLLAAARAAGVPVTTETGLALSLNRSPWLGVTGSSGKSTTAALAAAIVAAHDPRALFGGNIGGDLLTRVEGRPESAPLTVELSSFQLTYIASDLAAGRVRPPRVAVVTNVSPNHLDWHRDFSEYIEAKRTLVRHQAAVDRVVLNVDDPLLCGWADSAPARVVRCSLASGADGRGGPDACFVRDDAITLRLDGDEAARLPLSRLRLKGRHNVANALEAVAAGFCLTRDSRALEAGAASFDGLPHRLQTVGVAAGKTFVNDSKATTPEAAILALEAIAEPKILIAGGYDKRSPFEALGRAIQERAAGLVLVGTAGGRIREAALAAASARPAGMGELPVIEMGDDFAVAVAGAFQLCPEGGVVLLSPACASYGMFTNYEERGRVFAELAGRLGREC